MLLKIHSFGTGIALSLLMGCGSNSTPAVPTDWNIAFEVGTFNTPEQPQNQAWSQATRERLFKNFNTLENTDDVQSQVVSNTRVAGLLQFTAGNKPATSPVYFQLGTGSKIEALNAGKYWQDLGLTVPDASKELEVQITYQNKTATLKRKVDKTSMLPLPIIQKTTLVDNQVDVTWTAVNGAKSYIVQLWAGPNSLVENWVLPGSTTTLKKTLNTSLNANQNYTLDVFALGFDLTIPTTTRLSSLPKPNVSAQTTTVMATKAPGILQSYTPSINLSAAANSQAVSNVTVQAGSAGLDVAYSVNGALDVFFANGNSAVIAPNSSINIPITGMCPDVTATYKSELELTTNDPAKTNVKIPLTLNCTILGTLDSYSHKNVPIVVSAETGQFVDVPVTLRASYQGLEYSFSAPVGSDFIKPPTGTIKLNSYESATSNIRLTCSDKAETRTGTLRVTTNASYLDHQKMDTAVTLKCFTPLLVKEAWSKPSSPPVATAAWNPSGTVLAIATAQHTDGVLLANSSLVTTGKTRNFAAVPTHLKWLNDTRLVLLAKDAIQVWDTATNKALYAWNHDFDTDPEDIQSLQTNSSKSQVLISGNTATNQNKTVVYGLDGKVVVTLAGLVNASFSPDGQLLAGYMITYDSNTGTTKNELKIYSTADYKQVDAVDVSKLAQEIYYWYLSLELKWDSSSKHLIADLYSSYDTKSTFIKYELATKTLTSRSINNMATKQFMVKSSAEVVYLDKQGQLRLYNLDTDTNTVKNTIPHPENPSIFQMVGSDNGNALSVFFPEAYGYLCGNLDFITFDANLELKDTLGIASCNEQENVSINAAGEVWSSNGVIVRKFSAGTGITSALYNITTLVGRTNQPSHVNAFNGQLGYFTDSEGYLYVYDFSKKQLVKTVRVLSSAADRILPSSDNTQVFTQSYLNIRVHDLQSANMLMNKVSDGISPLTRWAGPNRVLVYKGNSNGNLTLAEVDVAQDLEVKTYTINDSWSTVFAGITPSYLVFKDYENIYTLNRTTGERKTIFKASLENNHMQQVFVLDSDQYAVVVFDSGNYTYKTVLMDLSTGIIMKILSFDTSAVGSVSSARTAQGQLLLAIKYQTEGLKVFQVN